MSLLGRSRLRGIALFLIDKVADTATAKLERAFGKPQNPAHESEAIRGCIDEAHSLK